MKNIIYTITSIAFLVFTGCGTDTNNDDDSDLLFNGISISETQEPGIPIVAAHKNGEWMAALSDQSNSKLEGVVFSSKEGNRFTVFLGDNGLPKKAFINDYIFLFENYRSKKVDIAILDPNGSTEIFDNIDLSSYVDNNFEKQYNNKRFRKQSLSLHEFAKFATTTLTIAGCGAAVATGAGALAVAAPCGAALVNVIANYSESDHPAVEGSSLAIGTAAGAIGCGIGEPFSCAALIAELTAATTGIAENEIDNREEQIASTTGALRFGGVWERTDLQNVDAWFVVNKNIVYDVFYISSENCYEFSRGEFLSVDGDIFTYGVEGTDIIVELKYELSDENTLRVTRLSDNFTALISKSNLSEEIFDPECFNKIQNKGITNKFMK